MTLRVLLSLLLLGVVAGCSDNGLPLVPVSGKITFEGAAPPTHGTITFTPISVQEGLPRRPGMAQFDKDGFFRVTSFKENDGLVPGTYHPNISCWKGNPDSNDPSSFERLNYVPKAFQPKPVEINADEDEAEVNIDVPKKN